MKSIALITILAFSCSKTKLVETPGVGLLPPPTSLPTDVPPDLTQLGDTVVQADELDFYGIDDALKLQTIVATNTRYLSVADDINSGRSPEDAKAAAELALNTLSNRTSLCKTRPVGAKSSILGFDLRDCFGSKGIAIWKQIEDTAVLKIQSQTTRNKQLQFVTGSRIPIMHLKIFLETAFLAANYYSIAEVPLTENEFWSKQGIDRQKDFDERDPAVFMAAFQVSQIAPGHNRAIRRMENALGLPCYNTYDIDSNFLVAQSNMFAFPFPVEARRQKNFVFNAGEIICLKQNGTMLFALYAANGNRADVAPTTVVVNTRAAQLGLDADIRPRDCLGCHANTMVLSFNDEMRKNIQDNPFSANDKLIGNIFFQPQIKIDAFISADNNLYEEAIARLNIGAGGIDPVNAQIDELRNGYDLQELADFLYLSKDELLTKLNGSQNASSKVGALLQGGRLPFFALQDSLNDIIADLLLFKDVNQ